MPSSVCKRKYSFPGHTEFLAHLTGAEDYAMDLVASNLCIVFLSTYVLLAEAIRMVERVFFFFNDTATPDIYTLSLHDALPISSSTPAAAGVGKVTWWNTRPSRRSSPRRSEEHTSELQSHSDLVCRLLLEKKKKNRYRVPFSKQKTNKK